jgi:uncharacterized protein YggT (Ycf19 family)
MATRQAPYERPAQTPDGAPAAVGPASGPQAMVLSLWIARALVWLMYAFAGVATVLLAIAFFLQLTGANPSAPFAAWVYRSSDVLLKPFRALYPTERLHDAQSELNLSLLFAIFMYGLFALVVAAVVGWFDRWIRALELRGRAAGRSATLPTT